MRLVVTVALLLISFSAQALFQELYQGFKQSETLEVVMLEQDITKAGLALDLNKYSWNFDLAGSYSDSALESLSLTAPEQTIKSTYSLGLSKKSFRYGSLSVVHEESVYDLSNWSQLALTNFTDDTIYESRNKINYSYEILNDLMSLEEEEINLKAKTLDLDQEIGIQKTHLEFFTMYIETKTRVLLDRFNREFRQRAQKRVTTLRRRVRDGLSRKVDLNNSRLALYDQNEVILKNRAILINNVAKLEDILDYQIPKTQFDKVYWTYKKETQYKTTNLIEIKKTKMQNELSLLALKRLQESRGDSLQLSLSYTKNALDEKRAKAWSESLKNRSEEKIIALNYSVPFGGDNSSALRAKRELEGVRNNLRLKNKISSLKVENEVLSKNIERYAKGIEAIDEKLRLAKSIAVQKEKMYLKGQLSFDETLRAEESFLKAKIDRVNMLSLYEMSLAQKSFLIGNIKEFLERYKD